MLVETADMLRVGAINVLIMTFKKINIDFWEMCFFSLVCCVVPKSGSNL